MDKIEQAAFVAQFWDGKLPVVIYDITKAAHLAGWEQAKMNARDRAEAFAHMGKICCREQADAIKDAISRMEYKETTNGM